MRYTHGKHAPHFADTRATKSNIYRNMKTTIILMFLFGHFKNKHYLCTDFQINVSIRETFFITIQKSNKNNILRKVCTQKKNLSP